MYIITTTTELSRMYTGKEKEKKLSTIDLLCFFKGSMNMSITQDNPDLFKEETRVMFCISVTKLTFSVRQLLLPPAAAFVPRAVLALEVEDLAPFARAGSPRRRCGAVALAWEEAGDVWWC